MEPTACEHEGYLVIHEKLSKCPVCDIEKEIDEYESKADYWEDELGEAIDRLQIAIEEEENLLVRRRLEEIYDDIT